MYATAQRVRALEGIGEGINGFLYLHELRSDTDSIDDVGDVASLANHPPGDPVESIHSLEPGGNGVLSYLDVAAPDRIDFEDVQSALRRFDDYVPRELGEYAYEDTVSIGECDILLYLSPRILLPPDIEYRSLRSTVLRLFAFHRGPSSQECPLRIELERLDDEWRFRPLTTDVNLPGPPDSDEGTLVTFDDETRRAFDAMGGNVFSTVAESIFGMDAADMLDHGGVEIVDRDSGRPHDIVWRGP